jgi:hypothetical protein
MPATCNHEGGGQATTKADGKQPQSQDTGRKPPPNEVMGKMRVRPKNNLDEVLRSTATLQRMNTRLLGQEHYLHNMWWLYPKYHDICMSKWSHWKYSYPADLKLEGDSLTTVSFAWADAFDGKHTYDYFSKRATADRGRVELKELEFRASADVSARRVSDQLGYWLWDKPRVE